MREKRIWVSLNPTQDILNVDQAEKLGQPVNVLFCVKKRDLENSALELILPDGMLAYFEVTLLENQQMITASI